MRNYLVTFSAQLEIEAESESEAEEEATRIVELDPDLLSLGNVTVEVIELS